MTHEELLTTINKNAFITARLFGWVGNKKESNALRAVVELHKPSAIPDWVPTEKELICWCAHIYPCPTIQAIEKELK